MTASLKEFDGIHVTVLLPDGRPVPIALNESLFSATNEILIRCRFWLGGIICRGRYNWQLNRVQPWVTDGEPVILDVFEATTWSLIDALERDQFELKIRTLERAYGEDYHDLLKRNRTSTRSSYRPAQRPELPHLEGL